MSSRALVLVTSDSQETRFDIRAVPWVHSTADTRYIEISAFNSSLGQRLVRIISPKTVESQRRLSEFHDKLLSAISWLGQLDMQDTDEATIPANLAEIDLTKRVVYLIAPVG
jgi:hypothetical protein